MQTNPKKVVKVCFLGETKRLKITDDYANLVEQSKGAFGQGLPATFKFFYFDEENEIISINSQQDLMEALSIEDFGSLKLTIAESVNEARPQLFQQLQEITNIRESMSQSSFFNVNASQQPSGGIENLAGSMNLGQIKPIEKRKSTFEEFSELNTEHKEDTGCGPDTTMELKEDMGCGPDTSMANAIDCGTEAFNPIRTEMGSNTASTVTEAIETQTLMPAMESMATQAISNTAEMGCDPTAPQNTDFACQIDNVVQHSDMEISCQIIQPDAEVDDKPEAEVTCFKCEGTKMNNKGLPCRKCQGTGIIQSDEYAQITTVVREEILQYCKNQFSGMLDSYIQKKRADQAIVIHDVTCNGCQMSPIQGIRFKCSVRVDYNLCESCEANNILVEHPMLKIRQPSQVPVKVELKEEQKAEEKPLSDSQMLVHSVIEEAPLNQSKSDKKVMKYQGRFIKENFGDMHPVAGGKVYTKVWTFRNDGQIAWPEDTLFCQTGGDKIICDSVCLTQQVLPGQEYNWEVEFTTPEAEGKYTSFFRMVSGSNNRFGHKVWINIHVQKDVEYKSEKQPSADSFEDCIEAEGDKEGCDQPIEQEKPIKQEEISINAKPFTPNPTIITPKMIYEGQAEGVNNVMRKKALFELFELGFVNFDKNCAMLEKYEDNVQEVANLLCEDQ